MIVLTGFMAAGKSSVGRELARLLGRDFIDTDDAIAERAGRSIPEIFASDGEGAFRKLEREIVLDLLGGDGREIVALGGGAVTDPDIRCQLLHHTVILLDVTAESAMERIGDPTRRPMLRDHDPAALLRERMSLYREVASYTVPESDADPREVAADLTSLIRERKLRSVAVATSQPYRVTIGSGIVERVLSLASRAVPEKAVLLSHPSLAAIGARVRDALDGSVHLVPVDLPEGESSKSLRYAEEVLIQMARAELHRDDVVIALGGGVVTDLGGFVASVYARGIDVVHVPTTLLGQVDAAIGGKTGVDLMGAKNLIGTFHQPRAVVCDVDLLATLPREEFVAGLAEVAKYGFISDSSILDILDEQGERVLSRDVETLVDLIERCVRIKAAVVAEDEKESDRRAILNYGHTIGHAIELTSGLRHGEAVSLGMMAEAHLAVVIGLASPDIIERHRRTLRGAGLPTDLEVTLNDIEGALRLDKKYRDGVRFVLLEDVGRPVTGVTVELADLEEALARMKG